MVAAAAATGAAAGDPRAPDEREREEDESEEEEEEEVESSGDEDEGDGDDGSEVADLCDADAGSDEDPTFDPDADGDLELEAVLRSRMSRMSISASARKGRKGAAVPAMGKDEIDLLAMVNKLIKDGQLEKLKVYECKSYLRMHKLRLTGKKEVLLNRIREHIEVTNDGEVKYPMSSFVLNCKGDACKGDVVMFVQNIYRRKKGDPHEVKRLCGQRTNAGRIIKESYGTAKQQHTFTIEIFWSKGYKPWPPLHPLLIKGRNLYKDKTMRQPWTDEGERNRVLQEKHARGFVARKSRASRIQEKEIEKKKSFNRIKEIKSKEQQDMNQKPYKKIVPQVMVESMTNVHQRTDERKCPSIQNCERGNTRHQHLTLKTIPTQQNEVFPEKDVTRSFKQDFIDHQAPSIQHRGLQQQQHLPLKASPAQHNEVLPQKGPPGTFIREKFISHQFPSIEHGGLQQQLYPQPNHTERYQSQNGVRQWEGTRITSRKECIDRQAPFQHNGGSRNTGQHQISSKITPSQQTLAPKHHGHNDVRRNHRREVFDYQNNSYRAAESEPAYHPLGNFTQHAKAVHGSNCHQNGLANHQVHQPLRSRNRDFNSRDQYYGQDYYNQYNHGYRGTTHEQYHPRQNRHKNNFNRWNTSQAQYHTQQNQYQNYDNHSRTNWKQYHCRQNQSQQLPVQPSQLKLCNFYYKYGWCRYGEKCRYSHESY